MSQQFIFTGHVDYDEMMQMLKRADVGLILFQLTPNNKIGLPNKLFENIVTGIPTIAGNLKEMARIINQEGCGLLVYPARPEEISDAIEYLYKHRDIKSQMGQKGLSTAREKYNFTKQAEKLLKVYGENS